MNMAVLFQLLSLSALASLASSHAVILNAQGLPNSPASFGFQMVPTNFRNCTAINPCQLDATLIRDAEISANVVNECGRTELQGNIDIGENTENALAAKQVTQVQKNSNVVITIHQVNADGAGPFNCDLDPTSNGLGLTGQIPLNITSENVPGANGLSQGKTQDFNITVQMPPDLRCVGGSTANICTVRCRNIAQAGPFGGCFAVQQVDTTPVPNTAQNIAAFKSLGDVMDQIAHNQQDLPAAIAAIQNAGSDPAKQALAAANALVGGLPNLNPVIASPQQVPQQAQQPQFQQPQGQPTGLPQAVQPQGVQPQGEQPTGLPQAQPQTQPKGQPKGKPNNQPNTRPKNNGQPNAVPKKGKPNSQPKNGPPNAQPTGT